MSEKVVGLIGIGLAGGALAERWLSRDWTVVGYDPCAERREFLTSHGGVPVDSEAEVVRRCRQIVLSLPNSDIAAEVVGKVLPVMAPGTYLIDATTGDPDAMLQMAQEVQSRGGHYLDAPIVGSSQHIRCGESLFVVGGTDAELDYCLDLLVDASSRILHVGPVGMGARMKLVVNLVIGLNRLVLAEGLGFARAFGIDPQLALQALMEGPAKSEVMKTKGPKMLAGDFTPQARLRQHLKDVKLIRQAAGKIQAHIPLTELHNGILQSLVDAGHGDLDNSAVLLAFSDNPSSTAST